ncbi:MAG TPA: tRNA (adenosine(37)-N6)-dimethylallyltransferase MiaA [Amoebophilaceae bacterium]|nr:tRNA (adenosine(37)-N6)-dimethylallyltransferase MiaA [Amoebophilaceae bacterium]
MTIPTDPHTKHLIVLVGPTASGKTALSIQLADQLQTEIISSDARQFYKEIPIGTAQPTKAEQQDIPHHFLSFLPIQTTYTAGLFAQEALEKLKKLFERKKQLLLVGGSGLYIQALCEGLAAFPPIDPLLRTNLNDALATKGLDWLVARLQQEDPTYCHTVDLQNPKRVIRALEVCLGTGMPYSTFRQQMPPPRDFNVIKIGLMLPKEVLHQRIDLRVEEMMEQGLLQEAEKAYPYRACNALQTVGYRELFHFMDGQCSLAAAVAQIKANTKKYAKRQMTWFKKDTTIRWFGPEEKASIGAYIKNLL